MKIEAKMQEHDWVNVYHAHEIMIVPHYSKRKTFVLPGGREIKEQTLIDKGHKPAVSYLWPRPV